MKHFNKIKYGIFIELFFISLIFFYTFSTSSTNNVSVNSQEFIKWVEFNASYEALNAAYEMDVSTYDSELHLNWIELLAYIATKNGGNFPKSAVSDLIDLKSKLVDKNQSMDELTKDMKYYKYYLEAYTAVLGDYVGEYELLDQSGNIIEKKYGLKNFSPIAKGFEYSDYDDFGSSRTYGYKREHLGHDMMGRIGSPIIAVEDGTVEALGWNQYGGWRIGIRSNDMKRYYYYAHLRQNYPYAEGLKEGDTVNAGDVIGYMGHTGYSAKENVNNIDSVHLHFGIQLIFDESQKDGNTEIWINPYNLVRFLSKNRSEVEKVGNTREWQRVFPTN